MPGPLRGPRGRARDERDPVPVPPGGDRARDPRSRVHGAGDPGRRRRPRGAEGGGGREAPIFIIIHEILIVPGPRFTAPMATYMTGGRPLLLIAQLVTMSAPHGNIR